MNVIWTDPASLDVERLKDHLQPVDPDAAARLALRLVTAPDRLLDFPRIGQQLDGYLPREVRRIIVGNYELRYEIRDDTIFVLRVWHGRENRSAARDD